MKYSTGSSCFRKKTSVFFVIFLWSYVLYSGQSRQNPAEQLRFEQLYKKTDSLTIKDFRLAKKFADSGIARSKALHSRMWEGKFKGLKGVSYYFKGVLDSAGHLYYEAAHILQETKSPKELARVYVNLAKLYRKTSDYPRAIKIYDEALKIYLSLDDKEGEATVYNESGVVYEYMKNYDEAFRRYSKSLEIQKTRGDLVGQGYALEFIGGVKILQKKYREAEQYLLEALETRRRTDDYFATALNYNVLGNLYSETKDVSKALQQFQISNAIAEKMGYFDLMAANYKGLSEIEKYRGNFADAYKNLEKYKKVSDSIFNLGKAKQVEELSLKYETEKKDREILESRNKIFRQKVVVFSLIGLLLLALFYYKNYQHRQQIKLQKEILHQQDLASRAVMNAEDTERKRMAIHLHDGVGQMLTATNMNLMVLDEFKDDVETFNTIISKTKSILGDAITEVRTLSHQIMPNMLITNSLSSALKDLIEKTSSPKLHLYLKINGLEDNLDDNVQIVMFRVIQECINNTIKHAQASEVFITLNQDNKEITAEFRDNGVGFNADAFSSRSGGMGLENIRSRIELLKGRFTVKSSEGNGTEIFVQIPLNHEGQV